MKRTIGAGVLAVAAGLSGCVVREVPVGGEAPRCRLDADCSAQGLADHVCELGGCEPKPAGPQPADPRWACLDGGDPIETTTPTIPVSLKVTTPTRLPIAEALVRACPRLQPLGCDNGEGLGADVVTAPSGEARLEVPANFDGYFEVRGQVAGPDYVRTRVYLPPREIARGGGLEVFLFTSEEASSLASSVGGSFALGGPGMSLALATALDCAGKPAEGVFFDLTSPALLTELSRSSYTSLSLSEGNTSATGGSGTFVLTNLKAGALTLSATIGARQQTLAETAAAFTREGWTTLVFVTP